MAEATKKRRKPRKPQYKSYPGAVSVTVHSPDGSPVSSEVLDRFVDQATRIAQENRLIVNVAKG